jgi:DNA-binding transcriptional MerR regulator
MSDQPLTVYQAASHLGISVHTVRRWCKDFSQHLSEGANPETGASRRLSFNDMQVLSEVSRLRGEGLSVPLIHERLNETIFPMPIIEASQAPRTAQEGPGTALAVVEALQSIVNPLAARLDALEGQESRLQALEAQRMRFDAVWLVVAGFIAGLIVGLAVWWF